jgi:transposase-like protein
MKVKNKYVIRSYISEAKFRQIILLFSEDLTSLNRQTINKYLTTIRLGILELSMLQSAPLVGQIEIDESYFGARRVRGKCGRGALRKTIVFGLLKRGDKVYTEIVTECSAATIQSIIKGKTSIDSVIHFDGWREYNGLVDFGYKKHFRVHHGKNEFARSNAHINGMESFWGYAKIRLVKLKGMIKESRINIGLLKWDDYVVFYKTKPFNGVAYELHPDNSLWSEITYKMKLVKNGILMVN